ncbi:hypothetical protein GMORB2_6912 [Geosmithia morbida]|uniref:Uncharacterized protein n=1 Tax=Geosmithia morbida TaxID=1094350 RepID=A0A9P4YV39_9HYPO|nr:uncharacterized protein GMORB2_6912 [Geosmithia morbida]KAF4122605.1 hypothetical protein GMORB2_6912 [Geosmithia morbida]
MAKAQEATQGAADPSSAAQHGDSAPTYDAADRGGAAPSVSSPFNFPSESDLPSYTATSPGGGVSSQRPVAIPQVRPAPDSPSVPAFPPSILGHGIPEGTLLSFLETVSAFLAAKVGDRAISHAGDMARRFIEHPKNVGKHVVSHAKNWGKNIGPDAKKGNVVGIIGGVVSIPIVSVPGVVRAVVGLPGSAVNAIVEKPQTPAQRAAAYAAVANREWLHSRGLRAQLFDSNELAQWLDITVSDLMSSARAYGDRSSAARQLTGLAERIAPLEVQSGDATLELASEAIWLVLLPFAGEGEE